MINKFTIVLEKRDLITRFNEFWILIQNINFWILSGVKAFQKSIKSILHTFNYSLHPYVLKVVTCWLSMSSVLVDARVDISMRLALLSVRVSVVVDSLSLVVVALFSFYPTWKL